MEEQEQKPVVNAEFLITDATTGEVLDTGQFVIADEQGQEVTSFVGSSTVSSEIGANVVAFNLLPGTYVIVEQQTPTSMQPTTSCEGEKDEDVLVNYVAVPFRRVVLKSQRAMQTFNLAYERKPDCVAIVPYKPATKKAALPETRNKFLLFMGLCAALSLLWLWLVAPIIWMTIFGLLSLASGFSLSFAIGNLVDYVSQFLFRGWSAVLLLSSTYQSSPLLLVLSLAAAGVGIFLSCKWLAKKMPFRLTPSKTLLDELPKATGANELGSGRLITDPEEIAENLETCSGDAEGMELAGPVFGSVPPSPVSAATKLTASVVKETAYAIRERHRPEYNKIWSCLDPRFVYSTVDENTLIIGDTRAGKTRRVLLSTIDLLSRAEKESLLILDPKGELYGLTSTALRNRGIKVNRIDFRNPRFSDRWNPMSLVVAAAKANDGKGDYDAMNSAAADLVAMIFPTDKDTGPNAFFNNGARTYMKSAILLVASWDTIPDSQRNLATVSRVIDQYGTPEAVDPDKPNSEKFTPYTWILDNLSLDHPAVEAFSGARGVVDKERSQFVTTALTELRDFRDSNIAAMTSVTDVPLNQLGTERSVTYLIIPHEKDTYSSFATLFIQQAYSELISESSKRGGRLPFRVNFICEEFGQIPPIPNLDKKLSTSLSAGIRWVIILQSIAQLITNYGRDEKDTIQTNCENKIIIKTTDGQNTGRWFSALLGDYTIAIEGSSKSGKAMAAVADSKSKNTRLGARPLLTPSEVCRWRADWGALMHRGASDGGYVIPLPDVSKTSTTAAFGLGDPEHNRIKMERALYGNNPPDRDVMEPWRMEYGFFVNASKKKKSKYKPRPDGTYSDSQKRMAYKEFREYLLMRREVYNKRQGPQLPGNENDSKQEWTVFYDPQTGEALTDIMPKQAASIVLEKDPSLSRAKKETGTSKADVQNRLEIIKKDKQAAKQKPNQQNKQQTKPERSKNQKADQQAQNNQAGSGNATPSHEAAKQTQPSPGKPVATPKSADDVCF